MTATDTSYLFAPRWAEMADGKSSLFEMVPWLEERDRKLEDFLTAIYTSSTGGVVATSGLTLYAITDTSQLNATSNWTIDYPKAVTFWEAVGDTEPFAQIFTASLGIDKQLRIEALNGASIELASVNPSETDSTSITIAADQLGAYNGSKFFFQCSTSTYLELDPNYVAVGAPGIGWILNAGSENGFALLSGTSFELADNIFYFRDFSTPGDKAFYDSGTGLIYFEATTGYRFNSPTAFTYTVDASYNFYSRNRASAAYDGANFYGEDTAHPLLTLYNFTTDTATCFHHDGTNNQVDVFAKDLTTYRPIKASAFTVSSSRATKTEIRPYTDAPRLSPVRFVRDGKEQVGFIAEEVQALFPEASDGTGVDLMPVVASLMERVNRLEHGS